MQTLERFTWKQKTGILLFIAKYLGTCNRGNECGVKIHEPLTVCGPSKSLAVATRVKGLRAPKEDNTIMGFNKDEVHTEMFHMTEDLAGELFEEKGFADDEGLYIHGMKEDPSDGIIKVEWRNLYEEAVTLHVRRAVVTDWMEERE